ncbi:Alpha/Beta hydrolase protein [Collybia nuda]|uniref:Alpha/Beta hydrolase protein n=1 Tax=Collybia nuda TaxID=64659 RepID=A0A9P5XWS3_9AGAR|nr:Alpha/Beta hydrolase protein [Collybia nuda]KAF9457136.1 Alpha/Beta hydrolase protein [Collybia nuda]
MPRVKFDTPTGPLDVNYVISTPTNPNSPGIDEELPSILLIHSGYIAQEIFEPQFADPALRKRFNLISYDMRSWGTTVGQVERSVYTPKTAADDVVRFLEALDLPPLHVFSISIGCTVALELTVARPERVLSLTLCSPLPTHEPEDIAEGRHQVYRYWSQSFNHDGTTPPGEPLPMDLDMLEDLKRGSQELMFNDQISRLTEAMTQTAIEHAVNNWAGTPEKLAVSYTVNVEWFLHREPIPKEALAKVSCPVTIIHCADDIAYFLRYAQEFENTLREAGVQDVALCQIAGPHFGSVVNAQALNPILVDTVLSASSVRKVVFGRTDPAALRLEGNMVTPFAEILARYGYDPSKSGEDSDDDDDIIITR